MRAAAFRTLAAKQRICQLLGGIQHAGVPRGWIFEGFAHIIFTQERDPLDTPFTLLGFPLAHGSGRYAVTTYLPASPPGPSIQFHPTDYSFRMYDSIREFEGRPPRNGEYCLPSSVVNPGFDSFIIIGDSVWIFQMTVSPTHRIDTPKHAGFNILKRVLPPNLRWQYVLVVAADTVDPKLTEVERPWVSGSQEVEFFLMHLEVRLGDVEVQGDS